MTKRSYNMVCTRVEVDEWVTEYGNPNVIPVQWESTLESIYGEVRLKEELEVGRIYSVQVEEWEETDVV